MKRFRISATKIFKVCVYYIFAGLFFKTNKKNLGNQEENFYLTSKALFFLQKIEVEKFRNFNFHEVIKYLSRKQEIDLTGPFRKFSTRVWQNARVKNVRLAMMCDMYFSFSKIY